MTQILKARCKSTNSIHNVIHMSLDDSTKVILESEKYGRTSEDLKNLELFIETKQQVKIRITATVETTVDLFGGETIEDLKLRNVDIYLHGAGEDGHTNKEDLGGNATIEII